jgi:DNA polymerase-3 subunit epsilon
MGRCLSPCLGDLDPNLYRRRLDAALALFDGRDGGRAILRHVDRLIADAAAERRYERAAWLRRRRERIAVLVARLGTGLTASRERPRLVLADSPEGDRWEAFWLAGGRVADVAPVDGLDAMLARTEAALQGAARPLTPADVAAARTAETWIAANEPYTLELCGGVGRAELRRFLGACGVAAAA